MINKKIASAFGFVFSLIITGCVGITIDVGDASLDSDPFDSVTELTITERYGLAVPLYAGTVIMDKDSITLVMKTVGGCEKNGNEFVWNPNFYYGDSATYGYRFSGDTLFLSMLTLVEKGFEEPEEMIVERILIGDNNEGLDGAWLVAPCSYYGGELRCSEYAYEEFLFIDGGDVEQRVWTKSGFKDASFDYMTSVFADELLSYIADGSSSLQLETVFYGAAMNPENNRYGVKVVAHGEESMILRVNDREIHVTVDYAKYKDSVHVIVKSGDIQCVGTHSENRRMTDDMCSTENADVLKEDYTGAWSYWSQNSEEFARCIDDLIGRERE